MSLIICTKAMMCVLDTGHSGPCLPTRDPTDTDVDDALERLITRAGPGDVAVVRWELRRLRLDLAETRAELEAISGLGDGPSPKSIEDVVRELSSCEYELGGIWSCAPECADVAHTPRHRIK